MFYRPAECVSAPWAYRWHVSCGRNRAAFSSACRRVGTGHLPEIPDRRAPQRVRRRKEPNHDVIVFLCPAACAPVGVAALAWLVLLLRGADAPPALAQAADAIDVGARAAHHGGGRAGPDAATTGLTPTAISRCCTSTTSTSRGCARPRRRTRSRPHSRSITSTRRWSSRSRPGGITVEVTGAVATQGTRTVRSDTRLNDVLQQAGAAVDADLAHVDITRGYPGTREDQGHGRLPVVPQHPGPDGQPAAPGRRHDLRPAQGEPADPGQRPRGRSPSRAVSRCRPRPRPTTRCRPRADCSTRPTGRASYIQHASSDRADPVRLRPGPPAARQPTVNPVLLDGDTIECPAAAKPQVYTITGAVLAARRVRLHDAAADLRRARIGRAGRLGGPGAQEGSDDHPHAAAASVTDVRSSTSATRRCRASTLIQPGDNINIPQGSPGFKPDPLTIFGDAGRHLRASSGTARRSAMEAGRC